MPDFKLFRARRLKFFAKSAESARKVLKTKAQDISILSRNDAKRQGFFKAQGNGSIKS